MTERNIKSKFTSFAGYVLVSDIIAIALLAWPVYRSFDGDVMFAIVMGFIATSLAFIPVYYFTEKNFEGTLNQFMGTVFGAVFGKLLFFGSAIVLVFIYSFFHEIGFTVGVLFSYIYKSVIEIIFILKTQKEIAAKKQ